MAEGSLIEERDDSLNNPDEDKTSEEKNEKGVLKDDISNKEDDEDVESKKGDKKDDKVDRSDVAQKIKYRDKWRAAQKEIKRLQGEHAADQSPEKKVADDKELAAQKYIRDQARREYEEIREREIKAEKERMDNFEEEVDSTLDDYPDITRDNLLDAIEEYDVAPLTAAKILSKQRDSGGTKKEKPRMPSSKRGGGAPAKKKYDDKNKSLYDISRELAQEAKDEGIF